MPGAPRKATLDRIRANAAADDIYARTRAARHPHCPVEILVSLAGDRSTYVAMTAFMNPAMPVERVRTVLAESHGWRPGAWWLWAHPGLTAQDCNDHFDRLAANRSLPREWIAGPLSCHACPAEHLTAHATQRASRIRQVVAGNPATPASTLEALCRDRSAMVRANAAGNPSTPHAALVAMSGDRSAMVLRALASRGDEVTAAITETALAHRSSMVRRRLAETVSDNDTLARLAYDPDRRVRRKVAANAATAEEHLVAAALLG